MPQQPGHSRFRPEDLTTRPVSSFRDLDAMTMYVDYLLMRIGERHQFRAAPRAPPKRRPAPVLPLSGADGGYSPKPPQSSN